VTITRDAGTMTFPAEFLMISALNPCPCGYFNDPKRECRCSPMQVQRYRERISGPLLDRIDIHLEVPAVEFRDLSGIETGETSAAIREQVQRAREVQLARFDKSSKVRCNARMSPRQIKAFCELDSDGEGMLRMARTELNFSARAYDRILKVARTVADLAGNERIAAEHVAEAIQYRTLDRSQWS
jgi:magnesium chelatase family protein